MAIWDFADFSTEQIDEILGHAEGLNSFGIEQDEDMMRELRAEVGKRREEEY